MSPFDNKYAIGYKIKDDFIMLTKPPKLINQKPTTLQKILEFLKTGKVLKNTYAVKFPGRVDNVYDINVDINDETKFNIDNLEGVYSSELNARNTLIQYKADISWFLKLTTTSINDLPNIEHLDVYKISDVLPTLIKNTQYQ